ncbi:MAG: HAMP domain-containing sensor histidine kinase [Bacteroidota bacterium]
MQNANLVELSRPASNDGAWNDTSRVSRSRSWLKKEPPHAQHELLQRIEELELANKERNVLMGMAAHDLRNPLSVILSDTKLLLNESSWKLNEKERRLFATVRHASSMMIRIVNDLVDIAGIEAGQLSLEMEDVEFVSLVNNSIGLNRHLAEKKNVTLELRPAIDTVCLHADPTRIEQVFNNLIDNAVKYSKPGGSVIVCVKNDQRNVIASVADHGPGMSRKEIEELFTPFKTHANRHARGERGVGLGLVIARMIVTAHHGEIWVESEEGKGSTFHVSLPLATFVKESDGI